MKRGKNRSQHFAGIEKMPQRPPAEMAAAITFAMAFTESKIESDIQGNFGEAYKGLNIYGAKVVDERRKALSALYYKI